MNPKERQSPPSTSELADPEVKRPEGPIVSAIESILAEISDEASKPDTFAVFVGEGQILYFRRPKNANELAIFQKQGQAFVLRMLDRENHQKLSPEIREALRVAKDAEDFDFINAFTVHFWSVEPQKITQAQAIKLTRNPSVMQMLIFYINREHSRGMQVLNLGGVDIAKKE